MAQSKPPPRPSRNGTARTAPAPATEPSESPGLEQLIAEVEELRSMLADAQSRMGRLLVALKQHSRHTHAVEAALAALRQLPPSPWQRTPQE